MSKKLPCGCVYAGFKDVQTYSKLCKEHEVWGNFLKKPDGSFWKPNPYIRCKKCGICRDNKTRPCGICGCKEWVRP